MKIHDCGANARMVFIDSEHEDEHCVAFNGNGFYLDPGDYGVKINFCPFCGEKL